MAPSDAVSRHDTVVLAPVLNEEDAIIPFLERWSGFSWDLMILDGMSQDRTVALVEAFQAHGAGGAVRLVRTVQPQGLAYNTCLGLQAALAAGYQYVIVADVGTQHPLDAERMLKMARDEAAAPRTIPRGSYFLRGSQVRNFPLYRRLVTLGAALASRLLLGATGTYPTHAFKVWPSVALEAIPYWGLVDGSIARCRNGPVFQVGMTWIAVKHGWRVPEYPMVFNGTKSTFRWRWIPGFFREVLRLRGYRPERAAWAPSQPAAPTPEAEG